MQTFKIPYPISANRYWRKFNNRMVVSAEAKAFKESVGWLAKGAGIKKLEGDVALSILFHPKMKKNGEASNLILDIDNAIKVTFDSLNGIAFNDDKQVKRLLIEVSDAIPDGGMTISIEVRQ